MDGDEKFKKLYFKEIVNSEIFGKKFLLMFEVEIYDEIIKSEVIFFDDWEDV